MTTDGSNQQPVAPGSVTVAAAQAAFSEHDTLKYHLLGPSLTKAGQDSVDQQKVATIVPGTVLDFADHDDRSQR